MTRTAIGWALAAGVLIVLLAQPNRAPLLWDEWDSFGVVEVYPHSYHTAQGWKSRRKVVYYQRNRWTGKIQRGSFGSLFIAYHLCDKGEYDEARRAYSRNVAIIVPPSASIKETTKQL